MVTAKMFWPKPVDGDRIYTTHLFKKAESREQKLERHCTVAKKDERRSEKH